MPLRRRFPNKNVGQEATEKDPKKKVARKYCLCVLLIVQTKPRVDGSHIVSTIPDLEAT